MFSLTTLLLVLVLFKVIYERWVTPLSQVPGPFVNSISGLRMRYHMMRGTLPEELLRLHRKYGPIVRVSPQRVSVSDIAMVKQVLGSHTYAKSQSYEMPRGTEPNVFSTRSPELSTERRKQLGPSFSHKHLGEMEPRVLECGVRNVHRKIDDLIARSGSSIVVPYYTWFSLIALDVIGALGFGQSFHALDTEAHELIPLITRIRVFNYFALAFPWLKHIASMLGPRLTTLAKLKAFGQSAIDSRRADPVPTVDLLQKMLDVGRDGSKRQPLSNEEMVSETILHLVAGVDTTSAGMTWTLALLLHNPHIHARLVSDIRRSFPEGSDHVITYDDCRQKLPYLSAVISESLRVLSPAPSMLPRVVPAGGLRLGGYLLPVGSLVCPSIMPAHMNPSVFPDPTVFNPDRFMTESAEKSNMLAFSTGVRACLGRNLALLEMHIVLANFLRSYDLQLPTDAGKATNATVDFDTCNSAGVVPNIPRKTQMAMTPANPDRDCRVLITRAPCTL
ncbi:hypothetical protein IW139_000446 [Coemansia sp. RSA 353]|nr:hypothetical protein GGH17_000431 [Coemansia sp. RSA 788]KAJ2168718.1 hypothetical protein GGH15_001120 [Coemansia sp. RSA 562]KAJ2176436.1 hypothetical protein GGH16_000002 [Coemansia sp. RSA 560]KAJ2191168.1 hypothetical protein EV181_000483 [Coemansia sp. RSA 532]KAJ2200147.1 hypothetical protein GGH18_000003 [Coemansia sp. RSA 530]KAJ2208949.1 hypothetical protein IW145_000360 [Coemansia sp. RSA 521]KAJ2221105.1 hypothetical protein IW143_001958 [Coemansia sp. RSA 520]KAJ2231380.1 hyp